MKNKKNNQERKREQLKKKGGKRKNPSMPSKKVIDDKRAKSANAFINYLEDYRRENISTSHIFKMAGRKWRTMSEKDKKPYKDAANLRKKQNKYNAGNREKRLIFAESKKVNSNKKQIKQKPAEELSFSTLKDCKTEPKSSDTENDL